MSRETSVLVMLTSINAPNDSGHVHVCFEAVCPVDGCRVVPTLNGHGSNLGAVVPHAADACDGLSTKKTATDSMEIINGPLLAESRANL